jgi:hypothetical protein
LRDESERNGYRSADDEGAREQDHRADEIPENPAGGSDEANLLGQE